MKYIFVILIAVAVGLASVDANGLVALKAAKEECKKGRNVDEDALTRAENGVFRQNDNNLECIAECMFKKLHFIKPNSEELDVEAIKSIYGRKDKTFEAVVDRCTQKNGTDLCDTTYQVLRCYLEEVNKPTFNDKKPKEALLPATILGTP